MSKKITEKIKDLLTPEDLKIFESAMNKKISDSVNEKLKNMVSLKEEELKKKYDEIADNYVKEEVEKRVKEEKAKLVENYDKKLNLLEKKLTYKLNGFLEHVIVEQISDEMLEKVAINETLLPVMDGIKDVFAKNHIEVDSEGEKVVKELKESNEKYEKELSEAISKNVELEERLEKSATYLMISEKTAGLNETHKKRVIGMFKDKKFDEVDSKIDDFITLIKEGENKKVVKNEKPKKVDAIISEDDNLDDNKKIVVKEEDIEEPKKHTLIDEANKFFEEE